MTNKENHVSLGNGIYVYCHSLLEALYSYIQNMEKSHFSDFDAERLMWMGKHIKEMNNKKQLADIESDCRQ